MLKILISSYISIASVISPSPASVFSADTHPTTHLLSICAFLHSDDLATLLLKTLQGETRDPAIAPPAKTYQVKLFQDERPLLEFLSREKRQVDCLIFENGAEVPSLLRTLEDHTIFLPLILLGAESVPSPDPLLQSSQPFVYHDAIVKAADLQPEHIEATIEEAISKFLRLPSAPIISTSDAASSLIATLTTHSSLIQQQRRLADKLTERLGYLGVYYKRNPANFLRHMSQDERHELLHQLRVDYREIILSYFSEDPQLNDRIDSFVNIAFFADVPVAQIVEIHMELMDEFSKQLKLEGRSDEILQDYRLTLIDAIAHLCEMYRRSIPRES